MRPDGYYWVRRANDNTWTVVESQNGAFLSDPPAPEHKTERLIEHIIDPRSDPAVSIEQRARPRPL